MSVGVRLSAVMTALFGTERGDAVVPPSGFSAWLVLLSSGVMAFLAVCALIAGFAAGDLADRWTTELARSTTIEMPADAPDRDAQINAVLDVLSQTPGIETARALTPDEQQTLLEPWLGAEIPFDALPVPTLIVVEETEEGPDTQGLKLRLSAEAPDAIYDDHGTWREPVAKAGSRLRLIAWVALALILSAMGVIVALAALAALAANANVIRTLRLVGARDVFVARAFVRRFTQRAFWGAGAGAVLGAMVFLFVPAQGGSQGAGIGLSGWQWLALPVIPVIAALMAFVVTRRAAMRSLKRLDDI